MSSKTSSNTMIRATLASVLVLGLSGAVQAADKPAEKCYGVNKAGKNDCQTASAACAGTAKQDRQADAWIFVPTGTCGKIAGGSTSPKTSS